MQNCHVILYDMQPNSVSVIILSFVTSELQKHTSVFNILLTNF